jgi:hypothetical protein
MSARGPGHTVGHQSTKEVSRMKPIRTLATAAGIAAAALALAAPAAADQPDVFGPFSYTASYSFWNCGFEVAVVLEGTFTNRGFVNPLRNINYIREVGTATNPATGATVEIRHMYTELVQPPAGPEEGQGTFTVRGLTTRVLLPGGGVVLIDAGYLVWRYPDGFVFVAHGNHELEIEGDFSELCAALGA